MEFYQDATFIFLGTECLFPTICSYGLSTSNPFLLSVRKIIWFADRFHSPLPFPFVSITCGVEGEVTMEAFAKTLMADTSTNLFFSKMM